MIVVRRAVAGFAVVGVVLLGGSSAWAQDADPCAPGPDGSVPEMCQGGMAPEPAPEPDPCPAQPVEPGDGVVTDPGTTEPAPAEPGIAGGEPNPDAPAEEPAAEGEVKPEPAPDEPVSNEEPGVVADPGVICAFAVPVSAPVADGAPEAAAGGGAVTAVDTGVPAAAPQLPRTGPKERLMTLGGFGVVLLALGGGALLAARRRAEA